MIVKISGSSGYLGSVIAAELHERGHQTEGISRELLYGPVSKLASFLNGADVVIHLAGSPILTRWTDRNKKKIIESRASTGKAIATAIESLPPESRPQKVISASGISIYTPHRTHNEESVDFGNDFLSEVVKKWETAWLALPQDVELNIFRMAAVLGKNSPTIKKMRLPFRLGLGGRIGDGLQPFPFVHEKDVAHAYAWAAETPHSGGMYILAAPYPVNNIVFTRSIAKAVNRPAAMTLPAGVLKIVYGEAAAMLTESPAVIPDKLLNSGFQFIYPTVEETLAEIFN